MSDGYVCVRVVVCILCNEVCNAYLLQRAETGGLEESGFEQSFVNAFGTSHTEFLKEFEAFIEKPRPEMLAIFTS